MTSGHRVHVVVPDGVDDPARPSGGNRYDRRLVGGLRISGREVVEHAAAGAWPEPTPSDRRRLAATLAGVPAGSTVLVDGLVASAADDVLVPAARRVRLVVLVHTAFGLGGAPVTAHRRERAVLHAAAAVVTTSRHTRQALLAGYGLPPSSVHTATPGVDLAPLAEPSADGGRLLAVGTVGRGKGHDVLVEALTRVGVSAPWRCDLVGRTDADPVFVREISARIDTLGLAGRIRLVGPHGSVALDADYAAADLLVLPSRAETYGMVVTEALARGVPVVASDVGGVPEALGTAAGGRRPGRLVPVGNAAVLGATIRAWLTRPELRADWRDAARSRRGRLTGWDSTTMAVTDVLDTVQRSVLVPR